MFHTRHLVSRLVLWYATLLIVIIGGIFSYISSNYSRSVLQEKDLVYEQRLDMVSEQLSNSISRINEIHYSAIESPQLDRLLANRTQPIDSCREILSEMRTRVSGIKAIYLYNGSRHLCAYAADSLAAIPVFDGFDAFVASKAFRHIEMQGSDLIYFGAFNTKRPGGYTYSGYLVLVLDPARLFFNMNQEARRTFDGIAVLQGGEVITSSSFTPAAGGEEDFVFFRTRNAGYSEWELSASVSSGTYRRQVRETAMLLRIILAAAISFTILISFLISRRVTRPILMVNRAMKELETGVYPEPLISHTHDETNELVQGFNHMSETLKQLSDDIAREQEEKHRYEVATMKAELDLIQSQVNPHFIHNTLNTLKYMALSEGNRELAGTISSFNALLRASISTSLEYTTVEEECHYVLEYLNIQKKRYASRDIECTIHVKEEASQGLLPRLILQPLVENSLYHGILPLEEGKGIIRIVCFVEDSYLHVYITDNGVGIPDDKLQLINEGKLKLTGSYNHVGMNTVKERLDLMYRADCKFTITSEFGNGTTIYFRVPYTEERREA